MALRFEALDIKQGVQKGVVLAIDAKPLLAAPVENKKIFKRKFIRKKPWIGKKPRGGALAQKKPHDLANFTYFGCDKIVHLPISANYKWTNLLQLP